MLPRSSALRHRAAAVRAPLRSFKSSTEYLTHLESAHCALPSGFRVGTSSFKFVPEEAPLPNTMTLTLIVPDEPTSQWGAVFTQNAFPGAPIKLGRELLSADKLGAIVINNKISNVCARGGGVEDSKRICGAIGEALELPEGCAVLPSSTGAISRPPRFRLPPSCSLFASCVPSDLDSPHHPPLTPAARLTQAPSAGSSRSTSLSPPPPPP